MNTNDAKQVATGPSGKIKKTHMRTLERHTDNALMSGQIPDHPMDNTGPNSTDPTPPMTN